MGGALVAAGPDQLSEDRRPRRGGRPHGHVPRVQRFAPSSRSGRAAICATAAGRGTSTKPTSRSTVSGAPFTAPSTAPAKRSTSCSAPSATRKQPSASSARRWVGTTPAIRGPSSSTRSRAIPARCRDMKRDDELWQFTRHCRGRWLNNLVEQGYRRIKRPNRADARVSELLDRSANPPRRRGHGDAGGAVRAVPGNDMPAQRAFVHQFLGAAA